MIDMLYLIRMAPALRRLKADGFQEDMETFDTLRQSALILILTITP